MVNEAITVIVPTLGRETLEATLTSVAPQLESLDQIFVIADGENTDVDSLVAGFAKKYPKPVWNYLWEPKVGGWGHPLRNVVLNRHIETTHVWTIDDDDVASDDALDAMRSHFDDPWTIFRMHFGENHPARGITCWRAKFLMKGDIGTPMIFARHCNARFGRSYTGDWTYTEELKAELGDPVWDEKVVCHVRP